MPKQVIQPPKTRSSRALPPGEVRGLNLSGLRLEYLLAARSALGPKPSLVPNHTGLFMLALSRMRQVVISGLSGAGMTTARQAAEEGGFFCIDNLPPLLWAQAASQVENLALGLDIRMGRFLSDFGVGLTSLEAGARLIFLEASPSELRKRFVLHRKTPPLGENSFEEELRRLEPIRSRANFILNTTDWQPSQLREQIFSLLGVQKRFNLEITTFGFKWSDPPAAELVLDVRRLNNPYYVAELTNLTGKDGQVKDYIFSYPESEPFYQHLLWLVAEAAASAALRGHSHYRVAVGCTGGRHRSVAVAERLATDLGEQYAISLEHRDAQRV